MARDPLELILAKASDPTPRGLASTVADLIRRGQLTTGTRLPTVRDLASSLSVSPATVSSAWSLLRSRGIVSGRGRSGVWVAIPSSKTRRVPASTAVGDSLRWDLAPLVPDPELLPQLGRAMEFGLAAPELNSYATCLIDPVLREAVEADWPWPAEAFLATNGGTHALQIALRALTVPGDRVAIESPTATPLLAILDDLQVQPVPVAVDAEGPVPSSLAEARRTRPSVFVYQPRAQVPCGHVVSARRMQALARQLRGFQGTVLEYDDFAELSTAAAQTLGRTMPDSTIAVRSWSKSHGPDLRVAVIGGAAAAVEEIHARVELGPRWTSRIMQRAVAWLLTDPETREDLERARQTYARRRIKLRDCLLGQGIPTIGSDGLGVWMEVADERYALATLAGHGATAIAGASAWVRTGPPHIRLSASRLGTPGEAELIDLLTIAARTKYFVQ